MMKDKPTVAAGINPDGLYAQVLDDEGTVLFGEPVPLDVSPAEHDSVADRQQQVARAWADAHPGRDAWMMVFDGDTGEPMVGMGVNTDENAGRNGPSLPGAQVLATGIIQIEQLQDLVD